MLVLDGQIGGDMITTANDDFRATTKSIVTKQYEDAVARRIKEIVTYED